MCGIIGWLNNKDDLTNKQITFKKMVKTLKKRGPDDKGYIFNKNILLGHRRLSIIDPKCGIQPMTYSGYTIVYNGELYNTDKIRNDLKKLGYKFDTTSDTEVLLKGFIEYKEKILDKINGIYSFGIYYKDTLFLARDRVGVKPLYYTNKDNNFIFSSNINGILKSKIIEPIIDKEGLQILLGLSPSIPLGSSIFKSVYELKPAHYLIYKDNKIEITRYWNVVDKDCEDTFEEAVEKIKNMLTDIIQNQMVSDVGISTLLSGGLDSSIITGVVAEKLMMKDEQLTTYSIDYKDNNKYFKGNNYTVSRDNEYIELMSDVFNTKHKYKIISNKKLTKYLKKAVKAKDLPGMADIDSSLLWFSKKISKTNKVVLSGECADEIFGGYPWFYRTELLELENFPWLRSLDERENLLKKDLKEKLDLKNFVSKMYKESLNDMPKEKGTNKIKELFYLNMIWFMPTLLTRKDRMTMYASLEARVPFADHNLIEYLWNLPFEYKFHNNQEKGLLREAFKHLLPNEITYRKKNPYPKTHNPKYSLIVCKLLNKSLKNKNSILYTLFDSSKLLDLIKTKGESFTEPWFGQLMTGPQLLAYLYEIDIWSKMYKIKIESF